MHRELLASLTLLGVASGSPVLAQEPSSPPPGRQEMRYSGPERVMQFVMNRRARLGLKVNLRARSTDSLGAYVDAVTPNGPAAKAGIESGDIISKVNGQSVLGGGLARADQDRSLPGLRLIELAARLEPNDTINIELHRGKQRKTLSLITADEPDILLQGGRPDGRGFSFNYGPGGAPGMAAPFEDGGFDDLMHTSLYGSVLADLELAPLNPDLGQYFGTSEGVLVINVPQNSGLSLKAGDVVVAVDGRKTAGPSHLLRILRSYDTGESFKLEIYRNRKRSAVTARLGDKPAE
jgi:S1-C subfamily serine protease